MRKRFIEPCYQEILDDKTLTLKPATTRMLVLLAQWYNYREVAESEWLTRIAVERSFNELITKFYHKIHKFPTQIIHIYKDDDKLEWTDGIRPSDTIKSLKLTSSVREKIQSGNLESLI